MHTARQIEVAFRKKKSDRVQSSPFHWRYGFAQRVFVFRAVRRMASEPLDDVPFYALDACVVPSEIFRSRADNLANKMRRYT